MSDPPRDCEHGQLARSCEICELKRELAAVTAERYTLRGIVASLIDLAEFWINRNDRRTMSEQEYATWLRLGHRSNAMQRAKAAIDAEREGKP